LRKVNKLAPEFYFKIMEVLVKPLANRKELKTFIHLPAEIHKNHKFSKESLRDRILNERGWELFGEKVRRQDLLCMGKFVSSAKARGITIADDHHKLFPIPQTEITANPLCEQNPGY